MASELILLGLGELMVCVVASLHEGFVALELAGRVTNLLASHVTTGTDNVADVNGVISLPAALGDLALLSNNTVVNSNNGTGSAIRGCNSSPVRQRKSAILLA